MNHVGALDARINIANFTLERRCDDFFETLKSGIDLFGMALGLGLSALGVPLVVIIAAPLICDAINIGISYEQGNYGEVALRTVLMVIGTALSVSSVIKNAKIASEISEITTKYSSTVQKAVSQYGDNISAIRYVFGDDIADEAIKYVNDFSVYIKANPKAAEEIAASLASASTVDEVVEGASSLKISSNTLKHINNAHNPNIYGIEFILNFILTQA